ncbi:MAG: DMT family transporter [Rickettsiales bacterium]|nr:DMT family transporter [Rickettsiales bacterium]
MNTELLGIIYKLFSVLGYSITISINKGAISNLSTFQVFFLSSLSCLLFVVTIIKFQRRESLLTLTKSLDQTYLIISAINFISVCATLYAIKVLDIAIVTSFGYLTPVLVHVLALLIFKEKFSVKALLALLISITGALIITRPIITNTTMLGIVSAFIFTVGWAIHGLILKKQTMKDHWTKQTFLTLIITILLSLPFALSTWQSLTFYNILIFILLGFLYTISKMFLVKGIRRTPLTLLTPIGFTKLIFNTTLAYFFFNEIITANTIVGSSLIIFATLIIMPASKPLSTSLQTQKNKLP